MHAKGMIVMHSTPGNYALLVTLRGPERVVHFVLIIVLGDERREE